MKPLTRASAMLFSFLLPFGLASILGLDSKNCGNNISNGTWKLRTDNVVKSTTSASLWPESLKIWTYRDATKSRDVRIDTGLVRGQVRRDWDGQYVSFLGIPYAAPPTSNNRFMAPFPPKPWTNMFLANRTVQCPQQGFGDENCLVINVFTPTVLSAQLPVLVYIHGGSFLMGSGPTEGLGLLTKQNLVVVTFNYRLGVLGFLCLGIDEALGNAGLKDQTAALQWVQRNIQQFGGDPSQVTLYGMNAGAASVEFHVLAGISDGLFHRAIIESGSATSVWSVDPEPINTAKLFADLLNPTKPIRNLEELVTYLQREPAHSLSSTNYKMYKSFTDGTFGFAPCIENHLTNVGDAFLLESPLQLLTNYSNIPNIPIMFVYSTLEGLFLRSSEYYKQNYNNKMNKNFVAFMPADLNIDREPIRQPLVRRVKREYFGTKGVVDDHYLRGYLNFFGDSLIMHGLLYSAKRHAILDRPVYLLEFGYSGDRGGVEEYYEYINSPGHGDFARNLISTRPLTSRSDKLSLIRIANLVANFAKLSDPTPTLTPLLPIKWPAVTPGILTHLYMGQEFSVRHGYNSSRKWLWEDLYTNYRKPIRPVNPFIFI